MDTRYDWFAPTAQLDQEWVAEETRLFDLMKETGFMDEDAPPTSFTIVESGPTAS